LGIKNLHKAKKMKAYRFLFLLILFPFFTSCLTTGLEELPVYKDAEITNFKFEYRWSEKEGTSDLLKVKPLTVNLAINKEKQEIVCKITVPQADSQGFTEAVRDNVSLNNIVGFCTISTAATIAPIGTSPALGKPADFSQPNMSYEVIAADKTTKKTWKLIIESFSK
jgi:hypothetical protein